jgi:hypothetical protein
MDDPNKPKRGRPRWVCPDPSLLGTVSDGRLARKWRCSLSTVWRARVALGLPPTVPHTGPRPRVTGWRTPPDLGTAPDRVIAAREGVSIDTVHRRRRALGIPPHRKHEVKP